MAVIKKMLVNKRMKKEMKKLREKQLKDVDKAMKKVYNPLYHNLNPKHQKDMSTDEMLSFAKGVGRVYNPPVQKDYVELIDMDFDIEALT